MKFWVVLDNSAYEHVVVVEGKASSWGKYELFHTQSGRAWNNDLKWNKMA